MTIELQCPVCEHDVPLSHTQQTVQCPNCKAQLCVQPDAELVGDCWKDRTTLVLKAK